MTQFPNVSSPYGAPMGRLTYGHAPSDPCRLFRVRLDSGGYDDGGAYWGIGAPLYCATDEDQFRHFTRACDRQAAAGYFAKKFPGIKWARNPYAAIRGKWWISSSGRIELRIPMEQARSCSHAGACDNDIAALRKNPAIKRQLDTISPDTLKAELKEYGAWNAAELADHEANLDRILWIACCDLAEAVH